MEAFPERLESACRGTSSRVCVGLDPDPARFPEGVANDAAGTEAFLKGIVDATADLAAAYKPNSAFFEALGGDGHRVLRAVVDHAHDVSDAIVILDVKRGDIGNTATAYAKAAFEGLDADAVTVAPYMGRDSVAPFADDPARGVFVLARTSNPGAKDLQDLPVQTPEGGTEPLWLQVARRIREWDAHGNLGLVAGATWPDDVRTLRTVVGDGVPFLLPGVGAQGGDVAAAVAAARDADGGAFVINAGRSILYASAGADWQEAAAAATRSLRDAIEAARTAAPKS